jgi:hypothetical protein
MSDKSPFRADRDEAWFLAIGGTMICIYLGAIVALVSY